MAPNIDASAMQGSDLDINTILSEQLTAYSLGEKRLRKQLWLTSKLAYKNAFPDVTVD